ncbi:MAG: hypothetical protein LIP03_16150 [Bacteroidales bacterium]|nr:hypothetical protein [Bacteroidales bacterium]
MKSLIFLLVAILHSAQIVLCASAPPTAAKAEAKTAWETSDGYPITILWDGLDANGVGSAYTAQNFVASTPGLTIGSAQWQFKVKTANGDYRTVGQSVNPASFTIAH